MDGDRDAEALGIGPHDLALEHATRVPVFLRDEHDALRLRDGTVLVEIGARHPVPVRLPEAHDHLLLAEAEADVVGQSVSGGMSQVVLAVHDVGSGHAARGHATAGGGSLQRHHGRLDLDRRG